MQIPVARADASAYIEKSRSDPYAFHPSMLLDGLETTSFQVDRKFVDQGNAYLYFDFSQPVLPDEMWIKNGFWKTTNGWDQYDRNCRVRTMTIDFRYADGGYYQDPRTVTLQDLGRLDWIRIPLNAGRNVSGVRIRIDDVYVGSYFVNDVCISEIMFVKSVDGY